MSHHPYSPSQLGRALACRGSVKMAELYGEGSETEESAMGTRLHAAVARSLQGQPHGLEDDEEIALVERCRAFAGRIAADLNPKGLYIEVEKKVKLLGHGLEVLTEGTLDLAMHHTAPSKAIVIDWKFGFQELRPQAASLQVSSYSAAYAQMTGLETYGILYMPRLGIEYRTDGPVSLEDTIRLVTEIRSSEQDDHLELTPSPGACEFCPALRRCPAPRTHNLALVPAGETGVVPAEDLGRLGKLAKVASKQAELVLGEIKERLKAGEAIPGWKLTPRVTQVLTEEKQ